MGLSTFSLPTEIEVHDSRLFFLDKIGQILVLIYGCFSIIVHESYMQQLNIMPVSQGGRVAQRSELHTIGKCGAAQNAHCSGVGVDPSIRNGSVCTTLTPDELVPDGMVFTDRLYVTTRINVLTQQKICLGQITQGLCIGNMHENILDRISVYTSGIENLVITIMHSSKDPFLEASFGGDRIKSEQHTAHQCSMQGSIKMAPIPAGPCADPTTSLTFQNQGTGYAGECVEGDHFKLGQILRSADFGAGEVKLLTPDGGLRTPVRDSGVVVHTKIVYVGSSPDQISYSYEASVIDRDSFATAKLVQIDATEWVRTAKGRFTKNETMQLRQGVVVDFSQEGVVGKTSWHALVVNLMALVTLLGFVKQGVTVIAKRLPGFQYQSKLFVIQPESESGSKFCEVSKPGERQVEMWDGHRYVAVSGSEEKDIRDSNPVNDADQ